MSLPQRTTGPWNLSICKRARNMDLLVRQSPASKLRQHLRPHEKQLQDLCNSPSLLRAVLEQAKSSSERSVTGIWKKDKQLSDSMDAAFAAVSLPWLYRKAVAFLNYLEVEDTADHFQTTLKAGGVMDVVECYPWSNEVVTHKRRDKRSGHHTGKVVRAEEGPQLQIAWEEPYGGTGTDTFIPSTNGSTLTQVSVMKFADATKDCTYRTVYHRVHSKGS